MDKINLLQQRKGDVVKAGSGIRTYLNSFLDDASFVETNTFAFCKDVLAGENLGAGVVTGYGLIDGVPVCVAAQNYAINKGGLSKAQAEKILKCQKQAVSTGSVMISVIESAGIRLGDGISALDGYASIIAQANAMYGAVPQIAIIKGQSFGAISAFAALHDFVIMDNSAIATTSAPGVIAAAADNLKSHADLFGAKAKASEGFATFVVKGSEELSVLLSKIVDLLGCTQEFSGDLNKISSDFNTKAYNKNEVLSQVFDGEVLELYSEFGKNLSCILGKIGGVTVGSVVCDDSASGVAIDSASAKKAAKFIRLINRLELPLVNFVNSNGATVDIKEENNGLINDLAGLFSAVNDCETPKISVVCGRAIGNAYIALASKELGYDNTVAWATSVISPIKESAGAIIEFSEELKTASNPEEMRKELIERYAAINGDAYNAALISAVDDIIEPAFTRQYVISLLTRLI